MDFRNIFKSIGNRISAKRYVGIMHAGNSFEAPRLTGGNYLNALNISLYTDKAIGKRAEKVSEIEFILKDKKGEQVTDDPLLNLLYKPNHVFTARQFWNLYQVYYDCIGEVYINIQKDIKFGESARPVSLHLLNPINVTPFFDEYGKPYKYEYRTSQGVKTYNDPESIIYIHRPDPMSPLRGRSLLKAGISQINTESQISSYHSNILANGGKVEGVFKFKAGVLSEQQVENLKVQYQKQYGDAKKAGMPLFLGGDADYLNLGLSPQELSFLDAKKMTLEDICIMTGVPKSMLASTNDVKFDNADADRAIFLRETIVPQLKVLTTALDEKLFPDERTLSYVDPTPENIDQMLKETESGVKNYYMTPNEARKRHGLDPIDNGDDILVPFNLMPLSSELPDTEEKKKSIKTVEHPLKDEDVRKLYWKMQMKRLDKREGKFKKVVNEYFRNQENRLIQVLQPSKTRHFRKKDVLDENFVIELEMKLGKEMFIPVLIQLLVDAGVDAMSLGGSDYDFHVTGDISGWLDKRADIFLQQINETTYSMLKIQFIESLEAGESRDDLIRRIRSTYGDIRKTRAVTIARTEVHNVTQYGTMEGYKQAGLTTKIWVAVQDASTRDSHAIADGEERSISVPFSNGLMFPGDPSGPPEEVVNCRCVI